MKEKINKLIKYKSVRSVATLFSGSLIAQLIVVGSSPFLSRLYTDEEMGIYTLMVTIVTLFGSIACLKYEPAIVVADNDDEAYNILGLCFTICTALTVAVSVGYGIYLFVKPQIWASAGVFALLTIIVLFLTGINDAMFAFNTRFQNYGLISKAYVYSSALKYSSQIILGLFHFGTGGLNISNMTGTALGTYFHTRYLWYQKDKLKKITSKGMKDVALKYRRQAFFTAPAFFVSTAYFQLLNFFIEMLYGFATFGIYSLTYRMLNVPLTLIGNNVARVLFFQNATDEYNQTGGYRKSLLISSGVLLAIAIPMVVILCLISPWLFSVFFGSTWRMSGIYAIYLAPLYGVRLIVQSLTQALVIAKKQSVELVIQCAFLACSIAAFIYCKLSGAPMETFLMTISLSYSFFYLILYGAIFYYSKPGRTKTAQ
ncbi:MAG: oligosaccharide flippase family protein [Clostridiaceae bacterium]|nr:oligosaccharide flippase family protein [Clostridiaceae bacterium]